MSLLLIESEDKFKSLVLEKKSMGKKDVFVVVYFFAQWCGPCKMFSNTFKSVSEECEKLPEDKQKAKLYKIDIDNLSKLSADYNILSIPTIILFKDGQEVTRQIGVPEDFNDWLDSNIF